MEVVESPYLADSLKKQLTKARIAGKEWRESSWDQRRRCLKKMREIITRDSDRIAKTIALENGKTELESLSQEIIPVLDTILFLESDAEKILSPTRVKLKTKQFYFNGKDNRMIHAPYGTIGVLGTWNYPFVLCLTQVLFAVIAGNACMLKGSPESPRVTELIQEIFIAAGFPLGLVYCFASGLNGGEALIELNLDKYILTGSRQTGKHVLTALALKLKPAIVELSGSDPYLILSDADWDTAVHTLIWAAFQYSGQTCVAPRRIIIKREDRGHFLKVLKTQWQKNAEFIQSAGMLRTGERSEFEKKKIEHLKTKGARLEMGDDKCDPGSAYFPVQVYSGLSVKDLEEVDLMAPVFFMVECETEEDMLNAANQSAFALGASVWTRSRDKAERFAKEVRSGQLWVNDSIFSVALGSAPFGGCKDSGFGKTRGPEGLLEMTESRFVSFDWRKQRFSVHLPPYRSDGYAFLTQIQRILFETTFKEKLKAIVRICQLGMKRS